MLLVILQKCLNYFANVLLRSCGEQKMPKWTNQHLFLPHKAACPA